MSSLRIRLLGEPVLNQTSTPVTEVDGKIEKTLDNMLDTLNGTRIGVALAAPQVGVSLRMFVYIDHGHKPNAKYGAYINPVILETDGEIEMNEGCLSIPELFLPIRRPERIHLRTLDRWGELEDI